MSLFNGTSNGNKIYSNQSITGDKKSIDFSSSSIQGISFFTPTLQLANRSWTFEGWIYPENILSYIDYAIVGHFQANLLRQSLHLIIRNQKLYFGLYLDDLSGNEILQNSRWYHFAFVLNCDTGQMWIYLNGNLDAMKSINYCYEGIGANLTFGIVFMNGYSLSYTGLMDQISFTNRSKLSSEISDDATLVAYFPFDNNAMTDQGPLRLNSYSFGNITLSAHGHHSSALLIHNQNHSYLLIENLVRLGDSAYDYSFVLWIKPNEIHQSTLIHVSNISNGSLGWCLSVLGLNTSGYLLPQFWPGSVNNDVGPLITAGIWTHVALTYSAANGLRLYVNGSFYDSINATYSASRSPNYVLVGSLNVGNGCHGSSIIGGQYHGLIDDLRIYSRELTASEIMSLAV